MLLFKLVDFFQFNFQGTSLREIFNEVISLNCVYKSISITSVISWNLVGSIKFLNGNKPAKAQVFLVGRIAFAQLV